MGSDIATLSLEHPHFTIFNVCELCVLFVLPTVDSALLCCFTTMKIVDLVLLWSLAYSMSFSFTIATESDGLPFLGQTVTCRTKQDPGENIDSLETKFACTAITPSLLLGGPIWKMSERLLVKIDSRPAREM